MNANLSTKIKILTNKNNNKFKYKKQNKKIEQKIQEILTNDTPEMMFCPKNFDENIVKMTNIGKID